MVRSPGPVGKRATRRTVAVRYSLPSRTTRSTCGASDRSSRSVQKPVAWGSMEMVYESTVTRVKIRYSTTTGSFSKTRVRLTSVSMKRSSGEISSAGSSESAIPPRGAGVSDTTSEIGSDS